MVHENCQLWFGKLPSPLLRRLIMPARRGGWCQLDNYSLNSNFCWNLSERLPAAAWLGIVLPHRYPAVGCNRLGYCHNKYFDEMLFHRCSSFALYSKHTFCQVLLHESDSLISLCQIFWTSVPSLFDLITCSAQYCSLLQPVAWFRRYPTFYRPVCAASTNRARQTTIRSQLRLFRSHPCQNFLGLFQSVMRSAGSDFLGTKSSNLLPVKPSVFLAVKLSM